MKIFFVCIICLQCFAAAAQSDNVKKLDSLFDKLEQEKGFNGNVLVAKNDTIIFQRSVGYAVEETKQQLDAGSVFELASVSKQFTAMGIMLLQQKGKLQFDDSLRKFFPELPYPNITVRHLLHHTSGLPDYMELFSTNWDSTKIATNTDLIALMAKLKPAVLFAPGEKWEYSNTGYAILGSIIEKVSGKSYTDFLAAAVFKPLGMEHTLVFRRRYEKRALPGYAYGYVQDPTTNKYVLPDSLALTATMVYTLDGIVGDGTVNSTTGDLFRWSRALDENRLVSKALLEEALTPGKLNNGKAHQYGYGWMIGNSKIAGKVLNHSGGWPGYRTFIEKHPATGTLIIVLTNYEKESMPMAKISRILYNIPEEKKTAVTLDEKVLQEYAGEYLLAPDFSITISVANGHIYAQATGQSRLEIFAEKEDLFFLKVVQAQLKFVRNEKKEIKGLVLLQNGQETEGMKIK
jgi:CubicO group peptidase (beta-lactamase class C family)